MTFTASLQKPVGDIDSRLAPLLKSNELDGCALAEAAAALCDTLFLANREVFLQKRKRWEERERMAVLWMDSHKK